MNINRTIIVYVLGMGLMLFGSFGFGVYTYMHLPTFEDPVLVEQEISVPGAATYATHQEELRALAAEHPYLAFARLREMLLAEPELYNECHGIMHQLGHEAFEVSGFQEAMRGQDALCGGGYIHGIIEARFGLLNERQILDILPTLCTEGNEACFHGLGHGLMITTYLDTEASLAYCDLLEDNGRSDCYDGVWMHIFDLEESGARDLTQIQAKISQEEITEAAARCYQASARYKTNCYFYLPRILAHREQVPFSLYRSICDNVEMDYRITCAAGSGHSIMKYTIATPNTASTTCETYASAGMTRACKEGAFIYYLFAGGLASTQTPSSEGYQHKCDVFLNEGDQILCNKVDGYRQSI